MEIQQKVENKKIKIGIWIFTVVVYILVILMHELPKTMDAPAFTQGLPLVNAFINGTCFVLLILSLVMIKRKNIVMHQRLNTLAMILSVFFLLVYVLYHSTNNDTPYPEGASYRGTYYFILITHVLLAGLSLPAILFAYYKALMGNIAAHRKIVRYTYPVWLYVTSTGVIVYLFLSPYYGLN
jgi:putative membrane protein